MNKRRKSTLMRRRSYAGYFFIFPLILGVLFVFLPNLVQTFRFAINDIELAPEGYTLQPVGLTYFKEALQVDPHFVPYLITSMKSFATDIPVIIIFSLFIASVLNTKFHGRGLARVIFFVPVILATGVISSVEASTNIISVVEEGRRQDRCPATGLPPPR